LHCRIIISLVWFVPSKKRRFVSTLAISFSNFFNLPLSI
jgi:hypothetical protein